MQHRTASPAAGGAAAPALLLVVALTAPAPVAQAQKGGPLPPPQAARVLVTENGFKPARLTLRRGVPARLTFVRTTDATCATGVLLEGHEVAKELPLNKPVVVAFTPRRAGTYAFTCGLRALKGSILVR